MARAFSAVSTAASFRTTCADATEREGQQLAARLHGGDIVLLEGDLAAGKTTFVRGLVEGLGGDPGLVSSPSFVIVQTYDCSRSSVSSLHHVDLYRLDDTVPELREVGLEDALSDPSAVTAIEWPKARVASWIPADARVWRVRFAVEEDDSRVIEVLRP